MARRTRRRFGNSPRQYDPSLVESIGNRIIKLTQDSPYGVLDFGCEIAAYENLIRYVGKIGRRPHCPEEMFILVVLSIEHAKKTGGIQTHEGSCMYVLWSGRHNDRFDFIESISDKLPLDTGGDCDLYDRYDPLGPVFKHVSGQARKLAAT